MSKLLPAALAAACLLSLAEPARTQASVPPVAPTPAPDAPAEDEPANDAPVEDEPVQDAPAAAEEDAAAAPALQPPTALLDARALRERMAALAAAHPGLVRVHDYGTSLGGLPLQALAIMAPDRALPDAQGLLFVAGLDGRRAADANVLLVLVESLLADAGGDLPARLGSAALVFVPRANPDGAEALCGARGVRREQAGNGRPDDADRDGRTDEDGPLDLDADGAIAWMAVPDGEGGWVFDEHDPRALRKARTERGESGTHRLLREGRDADGDGAELEDDADGAQPDANFPHGWREYAPASGAFPLSEPEARALADFVLAHPRLGGVFVVGGQDTLVSLPKAATNAPASGSGGRGGFQATLDGVHAEDVEALKELQRRLRALGKAQEHVPDVKGEGLVGGSFLAWAYHQAGRWPLALNAWAPPTELPQADKAKPPQAEADGKAGPADDATRKAADAGARPDDDGPRSDAASPAPAALLAWLDTARGGEGFVPWRAFRHEQLGEVQLGGLLPGVTLVPPQQEVDATAALLAPFTLTLLDCLPRLALRDLRVTGADGVGSIEVSVVNEGVLPTLPQLAALARLSRPLQVTLLLPEGATRLSGSARESIDRLAGGGGRRTLRWVIAGDTGQLVTLRVESLSVPPVELEITLP